jgi:phage tail-like protein
MAKREDFDRGDPWNNHYFSLEIDGEEIAQFMECSGFKSSNEVFEIQEGGYNGSVHKRPDSSTWGTVTLKKATTVSTMFEEWRDSFITDEGFGGRASKSGAVILRGEDGSELRRYSFVGVWPVSWEGPSLASSGSDMAMETLEIAFDRVQLGPITTPNPPPPSIPPPYVPPPAKPPPEAKKEEPPPPPPHETPHEFKPGVVQFDYDSAKITPQGEKVVDNLVKQMKENPEVQTLYVEGHTCDLGSYDYNLDLSSRRAQSVASDLEKKNPGPHYIPHGYSFKYPVVDNIDESHRSQNRRTQFFTDDRNGKKREGEKDYKKFY